MSHEVWQRVEVELGLLRRMVDDHAPLLDELESREPTAWEKSACAALVHAFYNAVENIFKNAALASGRTIEESGDWHAALLRSASDPASLGLVSGELVERLKQLMRFRHFFRHAYVFDLRWPKMRPLVLQLHQTLQALDRQVRARLPSGN